VIKAIRTVTAFLFFIFFCNIFVFAYPLEVHFINVEHGDAILIQSQKANVLIDGGYGFRWRLFSPDLIDYLEEQDVENFDALVATHPHWDHIGGLTAVLNYFPVERIYDSGRDYEGGLYGDLIKMAEYRDIPIYYPRRGEKIITGDLEFEVLHPPENVDEYSLNDASLVLRMEYGEFSFLFTGDIEKEVEKELVDKGLNVEATFLKVPHHGLDTSSNRFFLKAIDPEIAVIQDKWWAWAFPSRVDVRERYADLGIDLYRNAVHGDIVIYTDGDTFYLEKEKTDESDSNSNREE